MLYRILKPVVILTLKTTYRNIDLIQKDRIPKKGPVIFVANHPTAFMDPTLLAALQERPVNFLTRGDFYNNPLHGFLLSLLHVRPLYRMHESGFSKVKSNLSTFSSLSKAFRKNKTILVSVEGNATHEKRMRPVRKGAARIALEALESKEIDEICLVPVGFSFTYAEQFRSHVMIIFDDPIKASDYYPVYLENKARGINALTGEIKKRLEANVVIVDVGKEDVAEAFFILYRSEHPRPFWPVITGRKDQLLAEKAIADGVNALDAPDYEAWNARQKAYFSALAQAGITDAALIQKNACTLWNSIILLAGFIPAVLGILWSWPPIFPGKYLAANKVRRLEFKVSVRMGVSMGAVLVYSFLWLLLSWITSSFWLALSVPVLLSAAYFSIWYAELWHKWRQGSLLKRLPAGAVASLKQSRSALKAQLDKWVC